jgi:hypothetical protein
MDTLTDSVEAGGPGAIKILAADVSSDPGRRPLRAGSSRRRGLESSQYSGLFGGRNHGENAPIALRADRAQGKHAPQTGAHPDTGAHTSSEVH